MVRNIPGTDVELSTNGASEAFNRLQVSGGICGVLLLVLLLPLILLISLFVITYAIASIVFSFQALIVGADTYSNSNCTNTVGVWLIVFGSLGLANFVFSCCCNVVINTSKDEDQQPRFNIFATILGLTQLAWLFYGVSLVYNPPDIIDCNASQFHVFRTLVLFMFWGLIAILASLLLLTCLLLPALALLKAGNQEQHHQEDPDLEPLKHEE